MSNVFKCLRPRIIKNAAGQLVNVACGKCEACLSKKATNRARLCEIESSHHKHTFFITLTYSQENLPVAQVVSLGDKKFFFNVSERLHCRVPHNFLGVSDSCVTDDDISSVFEHVYDPSAKTPYSFGEGYIPYASKYDFQTFMKRLRYYIDSYCKKNNIDYEKIRFYGVSEYGPEHYRPHFHILLFFDSSWLAQELSGFLHKAWTYGRIDFSEAQNRYGVASYVASYCNSFASLPSLYKSRGLRPFALHSSRFGEQAFESSDEKIFKYGDYSPIKRVILSCDKFREVFAPFSLSSSILPRCYHFVQSDDYLRYLLYSLYGRCIEAIGKGRLSVDIVLSYLLYIDSSLKCELEEYLEEELDESSLHSILVSSQSYYDLLQRYPVSNVRKKIERYYSNCEYQRLVDFYKSQQEFIDRYGYESREFFVHFYDNVYYKGIPDFLKKNLTVDDIERSKRFYDTINIAWEFVDASQLEYNLNPAYRDMCVLSRTIFEHKAKVKHHNDKFINITQY